MDKKLYEHIRARLYLYGVLGALPKLLRFAPEAKEILGDEEFSVTFKTRSGIRVSLDFVNGEAAFHPDEKVQVDMSLYFINDGQVNNLFSQEGISLPVPVQGIFQIHKLRLFKKLADLLKQYLEPTSEKLKDPAFLAVHVKIMLGLVVRALCQLGSHDPASRSFLNKGPRGLAAFSVDGDEEDQTAWILHRDNELTSGFGLPPGEPDVHVRFCDSDVALDSLEERLDVLSAVGTGKIKVEGLIPLADNLGYLMQRIPHYL